MGLAWKKIFIIGLLLPFVQAFTPVLAAKIWVEGKEAIGTRSCSTQLPSFNLSAETFLLVGKSGELRTYGVCPVSVFFFGSITEASMSKLRAVLEAAVEEAKAPLLLLNVNSEGGDVWEALAFARFIRRKDYRNVVVNIVEGYHCNSSCVLILAGGYKRLVLEQARFSSDFHGIRYKLLKILDKIRPSLIGAT